MRRIRTALAAAALGDVLSFTIFAIVVGIVVEFPR